MIMTLSACRLFSFFFLHGNYSYPASSFFSLYFLSLQLATGQVEENRAFFYQQLFGLSLSHSPPSRVRICRLVIEGKGGNNNKHQSGQAGQVSLTLPNRPKTRLQLQLHTVQNSPNPNQQFHFILLLFVSLFS
jgi:hypothetical protein